MANIASYLNDIKNAVFGKEVRGSIHDGIKVMNDEVEKTTSRQEYLESTFDELIINAGDSNAEIVDARVEAGGTSYKKLGDRLNKFDEQFNTIENKINGVYNIYSFSNFKIGDDWSNALIKALSLMESGEIYFPPGSYIFSTNIVIDKPITLKGTGKGSTIFLFTGTGDFITLAKEYSSVKEIRINGNINSNGVVISKPSIKLNDILVENCDNGLFINPNTWNINITNSIFYSNKNGCNLVSTGDSGQINVVTIDKCIIWNNSENGIKMCGNTIKIINSNIEANKQYGIYIECSLNNLFTSTIENNYFEANTKGNIFINLNPTTSKNRGVFGLSIDKNFFNCSSELTQSSGLACIKAVTSIDGYGIFQLDIGANNYYYTASDSVFVDLGNSVTNTANSNKVIVNASNIGQSSNYSRKFINLGQANIVTYYKTNVINSFTSNINNIYTNSTDGLSDNILSLFNTNKYIYTINNINKSVLKKASIYVKTDSTNYNLNFKVYEVNPTTGVQTVFISTSSGAQTGSKLVSFYLDPSKTYQFNENCIYYIEISGYITDKDTAQYFKLGHNILELS